MKQEIENKILKNAISLEEFDIGDLAWKKEEAEKLVQSLMNDPIGILGGDVYKLHAHYIEPLYDNWSCDQLKDESKESYFLKSKTVALNYLSKYPLKDPNILFAIVFTDSLEI